MIRLPLTLVVLLFAGFGLPSVAVLAIEPSGAGFVDVLAESGIDFVHSFGDSEMSNLVESSGFGVCVFDYDNDELPDLYFINGATLEEVSDEQALESPAVLRNRLYRNLGSWRFEDVTDATGVGDSGFGMGCVAGDLDNDGDKDLIVTNYGPDRWFRNDGPDAHGVVRFSDQTPAMVSVDNSWSLGVTMADFDGDGLLDVYTGKYVKFDPDYSAYYIADRFPGPLAYAGEQDRLYRNMGRWEFVDETESAGLINPEGRAMGVGAFDPDNDGWIDLFVSNDAMANYFYRNLGNGRFVEQALVSGLAFGENGDATAAMGVDFADFDRDGRLDLLVPDMSYFALYQALGDSLFRDVSRIHGLAPVAAQYVGWSGHFLDFDNDGYIDLFISTGDLHDWEPMSDLILRGGEDGHFQDAALTAGEYFLGETMGRGAAIGDLDNDGDVDVVLNRLGDRPVLLRNESGNGHHWLGLRLVGTTSNRDGVGARVTLESDPGTQLTIVKAGSGYLGSSDARVRFGLGAEGKVARVLIEWPSGTRQVREDLQVDRYQVVEEGK